MKVFRANPPANSAFARSQVALISVLPDRGPPVGGNVIIITAKLPTPAWNVQVRFGSEYARDVRQIDANTIRCIAPPGTPNRLVRITVVSNGITSQSIGRGDYRYMSRKTNRGHPAWLRNMRSVQSD